MSSVVFLSVSEPPVPFGEDMSLSDVLLCGLSHHDPTGTLRTLSEDLDPKATLRSDVPEAMYSLCWTLSLETALWRTRGRTRGREPVTHLTWQGPAAGEPRAALSG